MSPEPVKPIDWGAVRLVVFDVDGTLYDQKALRLRMLVELLRDVAARRSLDAVRVIGAYRRLREEMAEEEVEAFEDKLLARTAEAHGREPRAVRELVETWMQQKPLRHIASCRYPGVDRLFRGVKASGRGVAILSDYPAQAKLDAMELDADFIVAAGDEDVGVLKPHPRGLERLIAAAGVAPGETVLIGDRVERDGLAAQRAGADALIRSSKPIEGWRSFRRYDDPVFAPFLGAHG